MKQSNHQCQLANYIDVVDLTELVQMLVTITLTVMLIIFIIYQVRKKKVVKYIEGKEKTVVKLIILTSILASLFFLINNLFSVIVYFTVYIEQPNIKIEDSGRQYIYQIYLGSVWFVPFFINNFFLLISYLWHILMSKFFDSNQNNNRSFMVFIIVMNILQFIFLILKQVLKYSKMNTDIQIIRNRYINNIAVIPFTVISAFTIIYSSVKLMRRLEFITSIKNKKNFIFKTFILVLASIFRIVYNFVFFYKGDINQAQLKNDKCVRIYGPLYGALLLFISFMINILPIWTANTMFHKEIKDKTVIINRMESSLFEDTQQIV